MKSRSRHKSTPSPELRTRAEAVSRSIPGEIRDLSKEKAQRLAHELKVHQIELEMQNEELRQSQAELGQSTDRLSNLYDFSPVGYMTLDASGTIVEANLTTAKMLRVTRHELLQKKLHRFVDRGSQDIL